MTKHLGLIGFGAIAQGLLYVLAETPEGLPARLTVLVRAGKVEATLAEAGALVAGRCEVTVTDDLAVLLAASPGVVMEVAGHSAVGMFGADVLAAGVDFIAASIGAFSQEGLLERLQDAATQSGAQLTLPAGAIGGIDALAAARLSGITEVIYTGRKPPQAWAGSPAEQAVDLAALTQAKAFFEGSAREAASQYPKNANVAATLALAGMGFDATQVRLVADPAAAANTHEFSVRSGAVDFEMTLVGKPSKLNPKTSQSTVLSLARALRNRSAAVII
jgi:aspartate dehydrogenase